MTQSSEVRPSSAAYKSGVALSFNTGQSVSNRVVVQVSAAGLADLYLYAAGGGTAQLTAGVPGYFVGGTANTAGAYVPNTSSRLLDTRSGVGAPQAPVTNGQVLPVQLGGRGGIPASDVLAVVMDLVAVAPTGSGYLSTYADGASRSTASVLPVAAAQCADDGRCRRGGAERDGRCIECRRDDHGVGGRDGKTGGARRELRGRTDRVHAGNRTARRGR